MRFFTRKPKELREFQKALKQHDYETAVELVKSGLIPEEQVHEAQSRHRIAQAFWAYGRDTEKTAYIDQLLGRADAPTAQQDKIHLGRAIQALRTGNFDVAFQHAKSITDKLYHSLAIRKVATTIGRDPLQVDKAIEAIQLIPKDDVKVDNLRKLSLAFASRGHFEVIDKLVSAMPAIGGSFADRQYTTVVTDFYKNNQDKSEDEYEELAKKHPDLKNLAPALYYCAHKNPDGVIKTLKRVVDPKARTALLSVYAQVLGLCENYAESLAVLRAIPDLYQRRINIAYTLNAILFPEDHAKSAIAELIGIEKHENIGGLYSLEWPPLFIELAYSGQMQTVTDLLRGKADSRMKTKIEGELMDDLYSLAQH